MVGLGSDCQCQDQQRLQGGLGVHHLIPSDPYYWQPLLKIRKGDQLHIPTEALPVWRYVVAQREYTMEAALIGAYRDHSQAWLEAFKKLFLDSFIDPEKNTHIDQDVRSEVAYYRNLVQNLKLPTQIKQLSLPLF